MANPIRTLFWTICLLPLICAAESPTVIRDVRLGVHDDRSRLVIEAANPVTARLHRQGRRVTLTLDGVDAASLDERLSITPPREAYVIASHRLDTSDSARPVLVLDLVRPLRAEAFTLEPHEGRDHRLVLDLFHAADTASSAESPSAAADPRLKDVRIGREGGRTRIVVETATPIEFEPPTRSGSELVVTLNGVDAASLEAGIEGALRPDPELLTGLEVRGGADGSSRLKLSLARRADARVFSLRPDHGLGHRLVIDLTPASASAPEQDRQDAARSPTSPAKPDRGEEPPSPSQSPAPPADEWLWVEVSVNEQRQRRTMLVLRTADGFLMTAEDMGAWNLSVPDHAHMLQGDEDWFLLEAVGIDTRYDARRLTLDLNAPAGRFAARTIQPAAASRRAPTPSARGMFVNYDASLNHGRDGARAGALLEVGAFGGAGTVTANGLVQYGEGADRGEFTRLDTSWRRDDHANRRSLVVGDGITRGPSWAGNVRFAGVQWGNDFEIHPDLVTVPLLSMAGEASLPSTIELYVDDALRLRDQVDPGPFDIDRIPVVTGSGEARLVVTDLLGRQQTITRDFYASPRQLRKGLHDWNLAVGAVRENYGRQSFDYGQPLFSASHRLGVSDTLTSNLHAQLAESHGAAGAGASWLLPAGGILSAEGAVSRGDDADGWYTSIALQRQGRRFSGGLQGQWASEDFKRLGTRNARGLPRQQLSATLSARSFLGGTLGLSYTDRSFRRLDDVGLLTFRFSRRLAGAGFLNVSAVRYLEDEDTALNVSFTLPLGQPRTTASLALSGRGDSGHGSARLRRSLPVGAGMGYDLQLRGGDGGFQRGSVAWQNERGRWQVEAAHRDGHVSSRAQAAGGLVWLAGELFVSRRVRESFAVVEVGDFADIRVYADNQEVARTNARGKALIPGLRPYQRNRLRIDQGDLPLRANVDGLEQEITPYWRSGVHASFPVTRTRDALFRVVLESGRPLPAGAVIHDESDRAWPVGRRGEVFITGLSAHNRLRARHDGKRCSFELAVPPSDEPLPDLGTVVCKRVSP